jgi:NADH pyrophosphatase NudC (nudix superfamily)
MSTAPASSPPTDFRFCPRCATALERREHADRERNLCPVCAWVHWDNPLPVLAALVEYEGKILLARNAAWADRIFALITGFMERGETPEEGVARELKEETNLDVERASLIGVYEFTRKNEVIIAYHVEASGTVQLGEELVDYRLVPPEKLRPWRMGTGLAMADWMRARNLPVEFIDLPARIERDAPKAGET